LLHRCALLAAPILAALPSIGHAQESWPNRPVRIIVGFQPGGSLDVMTRLAAGQMAQRLGQPFVVETRTGASGNIGAEALARATPDGYTIGTVSMHNLLINPHLFKSLPYHPERDFAWISAMWDLPNVAVVAAQHVPARTLQEFAARAKAWPDRISFGSSGVDTTIHLSPACYGGRAKGRDPAPALAEGRRRPGRGVMWGRAGAPTLNGRPCGEPPRLALGVSAEPERFASMGLLTGWSAS
jgi:tripartite-type tricarboxylate transporter receptor subunit TctC